MGTELRFRQVVCVGCGFECLRYFEPDENARDILLTRTLCNNCYTRFYDSDAYFLFNKIYSVSQSVELCNKVILDWARDENM